MCKANFRIGYNPCVREEAIDMLMAGNSKALVARTMGITYPTVNSWLSSYKLAELEIDEYLRSNPQVLQCLDDRYLDAQLSRPYP